MPPARTPLEKLFAPSRSFARGAAALSVALFVSLHVLFSLGNESVSWHSLPRGAVEWFGSVRGGSTGPDFAWWRLLSGLWLHGELFGLLLAVFVFLAFGRPLERALGPARFVLLFVVGGLAGSLADLLVHPFFKEASTAAAGAAAAGATAAVDAVALVHTPASTAAMWSIIGTLWGGALKSTPAQRTGALKQMRWVILLTLLFAFIVPPRELVGDAAGALVGLFLGRRWFRTGTVPARESPALRRTAALAALAAFASLGTAWASLVPTELELAQESFVRYHSELVPLRTLDDGVDRGALADKARTLGMDSNSIASAEKKLQLDWLAPMVQAQAELEQALLGDTPPETLRSLAATLADSMAASPWGKLIEVTAQPPPAR